MILGLVPRTHSSAFRIWFLNFGSSILLQVYSDDECGTRNGTSSNQRLYFLKNSRFRFPGKIAVSYSLSDLPHYLLKKNRL